jgi:hypothetical protein
MSTKPSSDQGGESACPDPAGIGQPGQDIAETRDLQGRIRDSATPRSPRWRRRAGAMRPDRKRSCSVKATGLRLLCRPGRKGPVGRLWELVARDPAFGDLVLRAHLLRRSILIGLGASLRIAGLSYSPDARRVRDFAARNGLPCRWLDVVVQNHLLVVLALVAMDPPVGASADDTQDKKAEVFRAMPPADPRHYVRGQYQGYADVPGVARVRPPRRSWRRSWRSITGAGLTCLSSCGPARRCRIVPPRCGYSCLRDHRGVRAGGSVTRACRS